MHSCLKGPIHLPVLKIGFTIYTLFSTNYKNRDFYGPTFATFGSRFNHEKHEHY